MLRTQTLTEVAFSELKLERLLALFLVEQRLKLVFDPQTRDRANKKPRVLIADGFGTHETMEILEFCFENNIILCRIPSHTSHKLQPCDVSVFAPLKEAYRVGSQVTCYCLQLHIGSCG